MITYEELNEQNHRITELSNVLHYLFKDRSMCDTGSCCELFYRYVDMVKEQGPALESRRKGQQCRQKLHVRFSRDQTHPQGVYTPLVPHREKKGITADQGPRQFSGRYGQIV
jgi:hypothetical protein